jgi:hypothetical protein
MFQTRPCERDTKNVWCYNYYPNFPHDSPLPGELIITNKQIYAMLVTPNPPKSRLKEISDMHCR